MKSGTISRLPLNDRDVSAHLRAARGHTVGLKKGELFRMEGDRRGTRIRCHDGILWITLAGERADRILRLGEDCTITRRGLVLVEGLETASFEVFAERLPVSMRKVPAIMLAPL